MLTAGESKITKIVSTGSDGTIFPPCGRCRELMFQINNENLKTKVVVSEGREMELKELLPSRWQELWVDKDEEKKYLNITPNK